jgi:hypothetical protein
MKLNDSINDKITTYFQMKDYIPIQQINEQEHYNHNIPELNALFQDSLNHCRLDKVSDMLLLSLENQELMRKCLFDYIRERIKPTEEQTYLSNDPSAMDLQSSITYELNASKYNDADELKANNDTDFYLGNYNHESPQYQYQKASASNVNINENINKDGAPFRLPLKRPHKKRPLKKKPYARPYKKRPSKKKSSNINSNINTNKNINSNINRNENININKNKNSNINKKNKCKHKKKKYIKPGYCSNSNKCQNPNEGVVIYMNFKNNNNEPICIEEASSNFMNVLKNFPVDLDT